VATVALAACLGLRQDLPLARGQSTRDRSPAAPVTAPAGTATISGIVRSADPTGQPVRRATVSLLSSDLRVPLSTVTDDRGRFTFAGVPAGHFNLVASKPAHIGVFYGGRRPGRGPGTPIAVADGDRIDGLEFLLPRGGVVTGSVRLPSGLPAQGMTVVVVGVDGPDGGRRLRLAGGRAVSDDRGQYRVFGLPPGDYLVQVQPSGFIAGAPTGATDAPVTTAAEVSWIEQTAGNARRAVATSAGGPTTEPARGATMNYARVYFPGTPDVTGARVVTLGLGEVRDGIDVDMVLTPTAAVSGTVVGPNGAPVAGAEIALREVDDALDAVAIIAPLAPVRSADDGTFTIRAVPPGRYRLSASTGAPGRGRGAGGRGAAGRGRGAGSTGADEPPLWAEHELAVDGRNLDGVSLNLSPGMTVSGRLVFQAAGSAHPDGDAISQARVTLRPDDPSNGVVGVRARTLGAAVNADGTFEVAGLAPGAYRIGLTMPGLRVTPSAPAGGWSLHSIVAGGIDVLDRPIEIRPREDVGGVAATLTDRPSALAGGLTDEDGRPAPGYPIVVFSTDRRHWFHGSRRIAVARPATDGTFHLIGLPAGAYHASALVDVDPSDLGDPAFLELLVPGAVALTLTDGEQTVQLLRLARGR
jgi:protocatechuate 3,4-dioxygenase beta subunit